MPIFHNDKTPSQKIAENLERKIIYLENLMTTIIELSNGPMENPDPPHSHPHEQISYLAEGEIFVFIDGEKSHLKKGDLFSVPGNVPHCIQTLTGYVKLIDSFSPNRKEFIESK